MPTTLPLVLGFDFSMGGHEMNNVCIIIVASAALSGCASVNSVRDAPQTRGEERAFDVSYAQMVSLVEKTLPSLGLGNIEKQSRSLRSTIFLGTQGVSPVSWGEIVRVSVSDIDAGKTSVTVYWRHRFRDGVISFARDWTDDIFAAIKRRAANLDNRPPAVLRLRDDARVATN